MNTKISIILAGLMLLPMSEPRSSPISDQGPAGGSTSSPAEPVSSGSLLDAVPIGIEGAPISDGINLPISPQAGSQALPDVDALHPDAPFGFSADSLFSPGEVPAGDKPGMQDPNLKQVLRSIATIHRSGAGDASSRQSAIEIPGIQPGDFVDGQDNFGLSRIMLDNRTAANALRGVIDIKSATEHGTVFSIFGMGQFMLETTPGSHVTTLSELSTGQSVTLTSSPDSGGQQDNYNQSGGSGSGNGNAPSIGDNSSSIRRAVNWVIDFVTSPLAILLAMIAIVITALWGTVRAIASLRMQAATMRHQQPPVRRNRSRSRSRGARRTYPSHQLRPPA